MKHLIALVISVLSGGVAHAQSDSGASLMKGPEDPVALVRAAYVDGRFADVVLAADRALIARDATQAGELHFWRASALRRLGRSAEALVAVDAAKTAGFNAAELHLERALDLSALGRVQESQDEMNEVRRLLQDDPGRRDDFESRWARRETPKRRVDVTVRPQVGYDTNLVTIQDDTALIEESDRGSFFYGAVLRAKLRLLEGSERSLDIEYQNAARAYTSESDLSTSDNALALVGRTPLSEMLDLELALSYGEVFMTGEGHFRTERSVLPAFLYRPSPGWQLRISADWSDADYYLDAPDEQDRDGIREGAALELTRELGGGWVLMPRFAFRSISAQGSDYVGTEREIGLRLLAPEVFNIQPAFAAGWVYAPFDKPHSMTGFTDERVDRRVFASLTLLFPGLEKVAGFTPSAAIRVERWSSNIEAFDFTRWEPVLEFAINLPF